MNFRFSLHCTEKAHRIDVCIAERRDHRKDEAILFALGFSRNGKCWGGPFRVRPPCDTGPPQPKSWHFPCPKQSYQVPTHLPRFPLGRLQHPTWLVLVHKHLAIPCLPSSQYWRLDIESSTLNWSLWSNWWLPAPGRGLETCPTHGLESCWKSKHQ